MEEYNNFITEKVLDELENVKKELKEEKYPFFLHYVDCDVNWKFHSFFRNFLNYYQQLFNNGVEMDKIKKLLTEVFSISSDEITELLRHPYLRSFSINQNMEDMEEKDYLKVFDLKTNGFCGVNTIQLVTHNSDNSSLERVFDFENSGNISVNQTNYTSLDEVKGKYKRNRFYNAKYSVLNDDFKFNSYITTELLSNNYDRVNEMFTLESEDDNLSFTVQNNIGVKKSNIYLDRDVKTGNYNLQVESSLYSLIATFDKDYNLISLSLLVYKDRNRNESYQFDLDQNRKISATSYTNEGNREVTKEDYEEMKEAFSKDNNPDFLINPNPLVENYFNLLIKSFFEGKLDDSLYDSKELNNLLETIKETVMDAKDTLPLKLNERIDKSLTDLKINKEENVKRLIKKNN